MITELHTARLHLRIMDVSDSADLFQIWSDYEVTQFMNIRPFTAEQQAKDMIQLLNDLAHDDKAIRFSIIEKESGIIIGSCGLNYVDFEQARAEIGYDLAKTYWGKGYAAEAVSALLTYGFTSLKLNRMEAKVDPRNGSSIKLLERLRFTREGTLRSYERAGETFNDLLMYSRLASE